ncbi:hypothetical protein T439DRAFT_383883 [Meredithblackwellia eburnea MCA 4105]
MAQAPADSQARSHATDNSVSTFGSFPSSVKADGVAKHKELSGSASEGSFGKELEKGRTPAQIKTRQRVKTHLWFVIAGVLILGLIAVIVLAVKGHLKK